MKTTIEMAKQVSAEGYAPVVLHPEVRRLCELVRADEREACAKPSKEQHMSKMILIEEAAVKLVLETLERASDGGYSIETEDAITALREALAEQPAPVQRPVWVDVAIRGDMARAVFDAIRVAVPELGPWKAFDAVEVQRMADALKPYVPFTLLMQPQQEQEQ